MTSQGHVPASMKPACQCRRNRQEISEQTLISSRFISGSDECQEEKRLEKRSMVGIGDHLEMVWKAYLKKGYWGFPGGAVVESLPANAGDTGSSPGLGGSHMPRSSWAREPHY